MSSFKVSLTLTLGLTSGPVGISTTLFRQQVDELQRDTDPGRGLPKDS